MINFFELEVIRKYDSRKIWKVVWARKELETNSMLTVVEVMEWTRKPRERVSQRKELQTVGKVKKDQRENCAGAQGSRLFHEIMAGQKHLMCY